uniref:Uncharacterized protein n=1 Tax=Davidia involucrata TaxID=16924 RepID=A0A5B7C1N4_DAVIN
MEKNNYKHNGGRERLVGVLGDGLLRSTSTTTTTHQSSEPRLLSATTSSDFVLQWGNRKRLRCMKIQVKDNVNSNSASADAAAPLHRTTTVRVDRRVVRSDSNNTNKDSTTISNQPTTTTTSNGYLNLRHRPASPSHRILRNSESSIAMKGHSNGVRGLASPDRGGQDKRGSNHNKTTTNTNHHNNHNDTNNVGGASASSETAHDSKKGGSSSGSEAIPAVWPPKFVIALTNKEKEEDFMAIKGSKLPQRPKKRAKFIQRTLNLVSPGAWLCDLTLERYEVREKKINKKRPRGLKAMGNMDSDSE